MRKSPALRRGIFFVCTIHFRPSGFAPEGLFRLPSCRLARRHFLSLRFPDAPDGAGDSQNQRKENPMNTDELSTGGASPSAESKKREGRKHCLGYSNWSLLLWSWWGGKMGCGCAGRGLRRNIPQGRRQSHAVVAGYGAAVEGGLENMKIQPIGYKPFG